MLAVCACRKQDDEQGRLIDQVTSETSGVVEGLRMKQQSIKQKEGQAQQLRGQVHTSPSDCSSSRVDGLAPKCQQLSLLLMLLSLHLLLVNAAWDNPDCLAGLPF